MGRKRRRIESLSAYELCFRAKDTLPLVAYRIIDLIIKHALARAQRDSKVYLCHDIWNGSHSHQIVFTQDADQCKKFYMEVQKKITDCLKRLFGLESLSIWEGRPAVIKIGDLDEGIKRISYLYANPAQDNLVQSIEEFPGYSSFPEFMSALNGEKTIECSEEVLRLRLPTFPVLRTSAPSPSNESGVIKLLERRNHEFQTLVRHPNMWMQAFKVREKDISIVNQRILLQIRRREQIAKMLRNVSGKGLIGISALRRQSILKAHKPKKKERKIFIVCSSREVRLAFITEFNLFCRRCEECYREWLNGNFHIDWPPGAFKPPLPPNLNLIPA